MKYTRNDLINYRIQRAYESFEEARLLAEKNFWNSVANRLYYACFYAVNALFTKHDIVAKSHSGAKTAFHKHFIKTGIFEVDFGILTAIFLIKDRKEITRIFCFLKWKK